MGSRIEQLRQTSSELAGDYVADVIGAAGKFVDRLMANVATLTRGVIDEGSKVVAAACDAFLPDDPR